MRIKAAVLVLGVSLSVTACGGTAGSPEPGQSGSPKSGGQLTVANPLPPSSLDPIAGVSGGDQMSLYPIYDRLINFDPETLEATPGLATEWTSPDAKTLILTLRNGVTFQDGTPLDAEAVRFSLDRALDPEISKVVTDLGNIESVDATAADEVTIHLKVPDSSLLLTLADRAGMIVSPTAVKKWGADFAQHPVGAGPYTFESYAEKDSLVVEKNPDYWQAGKPYLDKITFKYFTDQQTSNNALQAKQADVVLNADLASISTLEKMGGVSVVSAPSLLTDGCYLNSSRAPFDNPDVRKAVAFAIDRDALNQSYAFGNAEATSQLYPKDYWAADPDRNDTFDHDPERARQLLEQARYEDGLTIDGLAFQDTGEVRKAEIIQQQLKEVGIEMKFDVQDVATAAKNFFTEKTYDMICSSWSGRPDPSQTADSLLSSTSFYNAGSYAAPGLAEALAAAKSAPTQQERAEALHEVTALNQEYVVWLPLLSEPNVSAVSDAVAGLTPNLYGKVDVSFLYRTD